MALPRPAPDAVLHGGRLELARRERPPIRPPASREQPGDLRPGPAIAHRRLPRLGMRPRGRLLPDRAAAGRPGTSRARRQPRSPRSNRSPTGQGSLSITTVSPGRHMCRRIPEGGDHGPLAGVLQHLAGVIEEEGIEAQVAGSGARPASRSAGRSRPCRPRWSRRGRSRPGAASSPKSRRGGPAAAGRRPARKEQKASGSSAAPARPRLQQNVAVGRVDDAEAALAHHPVEVLRGNRWGACRPTRSRPARRTRRRRQWGTRR